MKNYNIDREKGVITMKAPNKAQLAFSLYYIWLHECKFEFQENADPIWKGYTVKTFNEIKKLQSEMTDEEKKEYEEKMSGFRLKNK